MGHSAHPMASTSPLACAVVMTAAEGGAAGDTAARCSVERRGGSRSTCPTRYRMILLCSEPPRNKQPHARHNRGQKWEKEKGGKAAKNREGVG